MVKRLPLTNARSRLAPTEAPFRINVNVPGFDRAGMDAIGGARTQRSFRFLVVALFLSYMLFAVGAYVWLGVTFRPDLWVIALLIGAIVLGQTVAFLRDWIPFVFLIFGYEILRGIAGDIVLRDGYTAQDHGRIQIESLIDADKLLFGGTVPTLWLQEKLYTPGTIHWYDVMSVLIYALHFVFPLVFAFMLWIRRKERFWQFSLAFLAMTYSAFALFVLFPAAPPWLADRWGYIDGTQFPATQTIQWLLPHRYDSVNASGIWSQASPNPVAAMPSLHAAFPWLVLLFSIKYFGKRGLTFLPYNAALWFSIVYLGHHWVVDIIGGMLWATVWFAVILLAWPRIVRGASLAMPSRLVMLGPRLQRTVRHRSSRWSKSRDQASAGDD